MPQSVNGQVLNVRTDRVLQRWMNRKDVGIIQIQKEAVHYGAIREPIFVDKHLFGLDIVRVVVVILLRPHHRGEGDIHQILEIINYVLKRHCFITTGKLQREFTFVVKRSLDDPVQSLQCPPSKRIFPWNRHQNGMAGEDDGCCVIVQR